VIVVEHDVPSQMFAEKSHHALMTDPPTTVNGTAVVADVLAVPPAVIVMVPRYVGDPFSAMNAGLIPLGLANAVADNAKTKAQATAVHVFSSLRIVLPLTG